MKAEIIAIGNEIVTGNTLNSNAAYIAKQIQTLGIMPKFHSAVCDTMQDIQQALSRSLERVEIVFVTGGLGPTNDDLTKEAICAALGKELILYEEIWEDIKGYFKKQNRIIPDNNKKQAAFPKDAYILYNANGTAPGCILTKDNRYIVLLPGPPREMKPMLDDYALPYFKQRLHSNYYTIDIKLVGIGESQAADRLTHLLGESQNVHVAPYVGENEVIIRITAYGEDEKQALQRAEKIKNQVNECLGEYIIGYNEDTLETLLLKLLKKHNYTIATAESCTGGMLAANLVNCSGISKYFAEGFITYSNEAKMKHLGVLEKTLQQYGAVSEQTAKEMAEGVRVKTNSDIGLSTTGIAGPDGGTLQKPVGLVYIGLAIGDQTYVQELRLSGTRQSIREKAVKNILFYLYKHLK